MTIYLPVFIPCVLALVVLLDLRRHATCRRDGRCIVCWQVRPICNECCRCGDSDCNAGCIACVREPSFGWKVPMSARLVPPPGGGADG